VPPLTPRRIQTTSLPTSVRGYDRAATDRLLQTVADDYETIWLERKELREQVERLEAEIAQLHERERLVGEVLVTAERAASETRATAEREAEELVGGARAERDQLEAIIAHLRGLVERVQSELATFLNDALQQLGAAERDEAQERRAAAERARSLADDLATIRPSASE
jgi:cell division septum initiation protein DivIVA